MTQDKLGKGGPRVPSRGQDQSLPTTWIFYFCLIPSRTWELTPFHGWLALKVKTHPHSD